MSAELVDRNRNVTVISMNKKLIATIGSLLSFPPLGASAVTLSKNQISYGDQQVFTTSGQQTLTLKNNSSKSEKMWNFKVNGDDFSMTSSTCGSSLAPGKSCAATIVFKPLGAGAHEGAVPINTSQTKTTVKLTGNGLSPPPRKFGPKKWHPGHYAQLNNKIKSAEIQRVVSALPGDINGVMIPVRWNEIESAYGVYNFSALQNDFKTIKAAGKRMVVLFQDKSFDNDRKQCVPTYMLSDPIYEGGQYIPIDSTGRPDGCVTKRWVPAVMNRIIAAYRALGKLLDKDPYFEGISTEETALGAPSNRAYVDQLKRLATAMPQAFPTSLTNMWLNWRTAPYTAELIDHLYRNGVGFGGPDLVPPPHYTTEAYPYFPQYAGKTYSLMGVQATHLLWKDTPLADGLLTLDDVFHFAVADPKGINATHLFWWYFKSDTSAYDFFDVVDTIRTHGHHINAACPENLTCNAQ